MEYINIYPNAQNTGSFDNLFDSNGMLKMLNEIGIENSDLAMEMQVYSFNDCDEIYQKMKNFIPSEFEILNYCTLRYREVNQINEELEFPVLLMNAFWSKDFMHYVQGLKDEDIKLDNFLPDLYAKLDSIMEQKAKLKDTGSANYLKL